MSRNELLDLIAKTASVLGKLSIFYDKWQRKVTYAGGSHHALEFKAQRFMEVTREQERQLELLRSIPSDPIPSDPIPSDPIPSDPIPSSPELQIVEGIESQWHYHLAPSDRRQEALCGARTMLAHIPLDGWGRSTLACPRAPGRFMERWCRRCAETAGVQAPWGGGSRSSTE